jgi:hypothetical protein
MRRTTPSQPLVTVTQCDPDLGLLAASCSTTLGRRLQLSRVPDPAMPLRGRRVYMIESRPKPLGICVAPCRRHHVSISSPCADQLSSLAAGALDAHQPGHGCASTCLAARAKLLALECRRGTAEGLRKSCKTERPPITNTLALDEVLSRAGGVAMCASQHLRCLKLVWDSVQCRDPVGWFGTRRSARVQVAARASQYPTREWQQGAGAAFWTTERARPPRCDAKL